MFFVDKIPSNLDLDVITSIGVIHHIKEPLSTFESAPRALKQNGKLIIWMYGGGEQSSFTALQVNLLVYTTSFA